MLASLVVFAAGCIQYVSPPTQPSLAQRFAEAERLYADARDLYFQAYVTEANGTGRSDRGVRLEELQRSYEALRERALERLIEIDRSRLGEEDQRALNLMRTTLSPEPTNRGQTPNDRSLTPITCSYSASELARSGLDALTERIYRCYGDRAERVVTPTDTLDRLTVLSRLGTQGSSVHRRALFLALSPVWESVNGANDLESPYRQLVRLSAERWRSHGSPIESAARSLGLDATMVEQTLVTLLDAWRQAIPDGLVEPWDWWYEHGAASRRLSNRVSQRELERMTEAYFSSIGASPRLLGIRYDLVPRSGKTPVAFTQFGGLARRTRDGPRGADPWVFATYREGGLGNLVELVHETGHAIHIAAVDTRPAFADWPDSDPFTEALADVPALEAYEGAWQLRYLGDSATTAESLREKYGSVMMDVAWALFELRMHEDPARDPNATWTGITERHLRIAPHPELSWWAMRGQLVESPGYMMNYALGAMVAADVRAKVKADRGGFLSGGTRLYDWLSDHLYRFGRERTSRQVLEAFLGRGVRPGELIRDLERMKSTRTP
jgi:hypothetical protein